MKVARFDARYRLTLPPGQWLISDAMKNPLVLTACDEWVRPATARWVALRVAETYPGIPFALEQCRAVGRARFDWHPIWWSPAAREQRHGLWSRLARAIQVFRGNE